MVHRPFVHLAANSLPSSSSQASVIPAASLARMWVLFPKPASLGFCFYRPPSFSHSHACAVVAPLVSPKRSNGRPNLNTRSHGPPASPASLAKQHPLTDNFHPRFKGKEAHVNSHTPPLPGHGHPVLICVFQTGPAMREMIPLSCTLPNAPTLPSTFSS